MIYCFDIDGTICSSVKNSDYPSAVPFENMLKKINELYDEGNTIYFMTARGSVSGKDWTEFTSKQLNDWGFKYHKLITNQKPHADLFIDDKGRNAIEWSKMNTKIIRGVIAGAFDVIHPGYILMFKDALKYCNHLTVCLHSDPSNNKKMKPVMNIEDRKLILESIRYVDDIIIYNSEEDLEKVLLDKNFDVRILGDDYLSRKITAENTTEKTVFVNRDHNWSTTKYKKLIFESYKTFYGEQL